MKSLLMSLSVLLVSISAQAATTIENTATATAVCRAEGGTLEGGVTEDSNGKLLGFDCKLKDGSLKLHNLRNMAPVTPTTTNPTTIKAPIKKGGAVLKR